jgi:O-antigen/teichoic acid export membrane protein
VIVRRLPRLTPERAALTGSLAVHLYAQAALVLTGVLTARSLGPTDRGYWALLILIPAILQQLGPLGLPLATTYFIATDPPREALVLRAIRAPAVLQVIVLTAIQAVVLALFIGGEPERVQAAAVVTLFVIPGSILDIYGKAILQGQVRYTALNVSRGTAITLSVIGIVVLVATGHASLVPIAVVWVTANLVGGIVTLTLALARRRRVGQGEPVSRGKMMRFGLRGFLGYANPMETFRADQAVIGLFLPPKELGLYVAGLSFTNLPGLVSRSVGMIAFPQVASTKPGKGGRNMWGFFWISVGLTGVVVALLELSAGTLVPLFFGTEFKGSIPMTQILLLSAFFYAARRVLTDGASGAGWPGLGSIAEVASWVVLVPFMLLLVTPWGAEGVAVALAVSAAFSLVTLVLLVLRAQRRAGWGVRLDSTRTQPSALGDPL